MAQATTIPARQRSPRTLRERLTRNPVILKELRGRMRGSRGFVLLSLYLLSMSVFVTLLYAAYLASTNSPYSGLQRNLLGKVVFGGVVGMELLFVCFITPAFTVGAISGERERQTLDLLRTTLLSARALVLGKLASALSFILLLLVAAIPLQSLAFLLGGVAPEELLIATVLLIATAFLYGAAGLFFSSLMRRTLGATILSYAFTLLTTLGLPILLMALLPVIGVIGNNTPSLVAQAILIYAFGLLVVMNPLATAVAAEVILAGNQTAFYFTVPLSSSTSSATVNLPLVSPWLPFTLFSLLLGGLFILIAIHRVRRGER